MINKMMAVIMASGAAVVAFTFGHCLRLAETMGGVCLLFTAAVAFVGAVMMAALLWFD